MNLKEWMRFCLVLIAILCFVSLVVFYNVYKDIIHVGNYDVTVYCANVGEDGLVDTNKVYCNVTRLDIHSEYITFNYKGQEIIIKDLPAIIEKLPESSDK